MMREVPEYFGRHVVLSVHESRRQIQASNNHALLGDDHDHRLSVNGRPNDFGIEVRHGVSGPGRFFCGRRESRQKRDIGGLTDFF